MKEKQEIPESNRENFWVLAKRTSSSIPNQWNKTSNI